MPSDFSEQFQMGDRKSGYHGVPNIDQGLACRVSLGQSRVRSMEEALEGSEEFFAFERAGFVPGNVLEKRVQGLFLEPGGIHEAGNAAFGPFLVYLDNDIP